MSMKSGTSIFIHGLVIAGLVAGAAFPPLWIIVILLVVGLVVNKISENSGDEDGASGTE